ncbi:MAG TPA: DNA repair protein RecN [Anaerolineae bacterium]|nr:DNA repair protein RecN [Anaerolineae bacterium]
MLRELHIEDFAIIDELHLTLEPGFNILTGETGAGKSILIDAVTLLLGGRADMASLRKGAERARVEGLFVLPSAQQEWLAALLEREGLEGDQPDSLWLSRELRANGRAVARVNGRVVSLNIMREIAETLVDVHGQSEHLSLLRVREHLNLLDRFAGLGELRAQVEAVVHEVQGVRRELTHLRQSERERMQRIDLLRFQVSEIADARLQPHEHGELEAELVRLSNAEQLSSLASGLVALLEEGGAGAPSVLDLLGQGQRDMGTLARIDAALAPQAQVLEEVGYQLEDVARSLRNYLGDVEFNPKRLVWVEARLSLLRQLERKYGGSLAEVIAHGKAVADELETLEHSDERIVALSAQEADLLEMCARLCQELSEKRQAAAAVLCKGVEGELNDLRMGGARLGVAFQWRQTDGGLPLARALPAALTVTDAGVETEAGLNVTSAAFDSTGMDEVEFLVAPNVGEGLKPMTRIASGGETARLMLALKTVLSRADCTPTLIFDEIDQGIGGRIGAVVGAKLWQLTTHHPASELGGHQVLCITHLPQLAGFGDSHFRVHKQIVEGRTITQVTRLEPEAQVQELSQMLGTLGEAAHQGALEILEQAQVMKQAVVGEGLT